MEQLIIKSNHIAHDLQAQLEKVSYDNLFVLTDENTEQKCFPLINEVDAIAHAKRLVIAADDTNKTLENLAYVWKFLSHNGATRHSLLINLGGGMLTDLGGFAAASFKRGIAYFNLPTTLLGAVDAAVGGKTGINFEGYKNEIGAFFPAKVVLISSEFFRTLNRSDFLSGYAEMLKHALIDSDKAWHDILQFSFDAINYAQLNDLAYESVQLKKRIVSEDPYEKGIRKALNLGHTVGHAIESFLIDIETPVPHGFAVAWGLVAELYLSHKICGFPEGKMTKTVAFILEKYDGLNGICENAANYEKLFELMSHDKKNKGNIINFTLLSDIGQVKINQQADKSLILESIEYLCNAAQR